MMGRESLCKSLSIYHYFKWKLISRFITNNQNSNKNKVREFKCEFLRLGWIFFKEVVEESRNL